MPDSNKTLVVDNFDSFTFNLVQYLASLGQEVETIRNNDLTVEEIIAKQPARIVLSPGPSTPDNAGCCLALVREAAARKIPLLGVCLGHQCLGQAFGADIVRVTPMHGKTSQITHNGDALFSGIASPFTATRYHSLTCDPRSIPSQLTVTAQSEDGTIMAIRARAKELKMFGVQFHPESILTEPGLKMLENFLELSR